MRSSSKLTFFLLITIWVFSKTCNAASLLSRCTTDSLIHSRIGLTKNWPEKGSFEYYAALAHRDQMLRGRRLSDADASLAFSDGNSTFRISSLGFLHYTTVELGTPGVKFMVALDTGSDLFWVPCDCSRCAPTHGASYASDFELSIYNPRESSTSKKGHLQQ
ncbi:LOW QUALITY PROTEIN: Asp domain-containing protein [Populus alba x Populus x berolinensis]|nr:LOW QUALITY PROTEIN: Asp domain-containing protein [Populus alba x Populus x berolinensis]